MLFDVVLIAAVTALAVLASIIGNVMFVKGYNLGVREYNSQHQDEPKEIIAEKKPAVQPKQDKKLQMYSDILDNIENYNGTSENQKDIEVI